jgi:hypothetical protein
MWKRELHKQFPAFFYYLIFEATGGAVVYAADVVPSVSEKAYWVCYLAFLIIEASIKFVVIGEVFTHLLRRYPSLGSLARVLISAVGILLVFTATIIAAYASPTAFWLISATRILGRSVSVVQCGLIVFLFAFAAYFHLTWQRPNFGIILGFGIAASVSLACWGLLANWLLGQMLGQKSYLLDFFTMATYHVCVLIWCYCILVPQEHATTSATLLPEHNLELWNRELERLLQQ